MHDHGAQAAGHARMGAMIWIVPVAVGIAAGAIFLAMPGIDLHAARAFYTSETGFVGRRLLWVEVLRQAFVCLFLGCIALIIAGLVATRRGRPAWLRLGAAQWLFLAVCFAVGPGLVANLIFKDQWGRARPRHVAELGGSKAFTPPLLPADQCPRNCSFVSGEASSTYVVFYAGAAVFPQWAVALVITGTVGGLVTGLVRMSQGAHFLSDVVFAGVFMALTVLLVRWAMFRGRSGPAAPAPIGAPGPPP